MGVAQVVKADAGDVEPGDSALEGLADQVGVDGRAVGLGEHVAVIAALAGGHALFELAAAVAAQLGHGSGVEVDAAAGGGLEVALDEHEHTHFIPGVVIGASGDGPPRETDLYGVCDGIVLAGEAKTSPRSFCVDEVERDVELSAALDADAHVMVAFEKIAEAVTREAKRCSADNSLGLIVIGGEHLGTLVPPRMR